MSWDFLSAYHLNIINRSSSRNNNNSNNNNKRSHRNVDSQTVRQSVGKLCFLIYYYKLFAELSKEHISNYRNWHVRMSRPISSTINFSLHLKSWRQNQTTNSDNKTRTGRQWWRWRWCGWGWGTQRGRHKRQIKMTPACVIHDGSHCKRGRGLKREVGMKKQRE